MTQKFKIENLPVDLDGKSFITDFGTNFQVIKGEYSPHSLIGKADMKYLEDLRQGLLVSVSFHGIPISFITVAGGVVRLVKVNIEGVDLGAVVTINEALKNSKTREPIGLYLS